MSVDYVLIDPVTGDELLLPEGEMLEEEGGTYPLGGWSTCELNVTYNYGRCYGTAAQKAGIAYPGMLEWLQGRTAQETLSEIEALIAHLGTDTSPNYWEATEGNARRALCVLRWFAQLHPQGIWHADG